MKILQYVSLVLITISVMSCTNQFVDNGGIVYDYQKITIVARNTGAKVKIDYECNSACLIKLSSGSGLCVSKNAKFGVHEPRVTPGDLSYDQGRRVERYVNLFKELLPKCAVNLFETRDAFSSSKLTYFSGKEVLKSCPEIKECPEK